MGLFWFLSAAAGAQTATFTINPTLTPPCGASAGTLGNNSTSGTTGSTADYMRGSVYTLSSPATVYTLTAYCSSPPANTQFMVGIYSGAVDNFGSLIVQSAAQTLVAGWNGFPITPTYLAAGTYWLAYLSNRTGYNATFATGTANVGAVTGTVITFGTMPSTMPTPSYGTNKEAIYALYCVLPTYTSTVTNTPTITPTPTNTLTQTITNTATNTGTIFTNTPSSTFTMTPTSTATNTVTFTPSATPNLSLTPSCGGSFASFGDSDTSGAPVTAQSPELRACRYTLPSDSTVQTISLYATSYSAGTIAEVALYSNNAGTTTVGSLIAQSVTQTLTAGWNVFQVPSSPVTAGDYWLAYIYAAPVSYSLAHQTSPADVNTLAYTLTVPSWTFDANATSYSLSYSPNWHEPILANYCSSLATNTVTNTATVTSTSTSTNTATITATATVTQTPTNTVTTTVTNTVTNTPTITISPTWSMTLTDTPSPTITLTPTDTLTLTVTNTVTNTCTATATNSSTNTATVSVTNSVTNTATNSATSTATNTVTNTPTVTNSNTVTDTPIYSYTFTQTPTITSTNTVTMTVTNTATNTSTSTDTNTATNTATSSVSSTTTPTATNSATNSATGTSTSSPTATFTNTLTNTGTVAMTFTFTQTPSMTATQTFTTTVMNSPTGTSTSSPTATFTSTPTSSVVNIVSMFPNPLTGQGGATLQVNFDKPHDYVEVKIYTLAFRKIYDDRVNFVSAGPFSYYIDPSKVKGGPLMANGLYYVVMTTPSNRWMNKLLVLR
jgi:hypothetical protein